MKSQLKPISILLLCVALGFISCDKEKKDDTKNLFMALLLNSPRVYGQSGNLTTSDENKGGVTPNSLNSPYGVAVDAGGVYITDSGNNRVLYYAWSSTTATRVYGQPDFVSSTSNNGGVSATSLSIPRGIAVDAGGVYIADSPNNRVLYYAGTSTTATRVYGQPNFTSNTANRGGANPDADSLSGPYGVEVDASGVYITEYWNNRVLYYPGTSTTAIRVYGQGGDFTTAVENKGGLSANSLRRPYGVAVDAGGVYIADSQNSRMLYYEGTSTTATRVYGQPNFTSNTVNNGGIGAGSLNTPSDVFVAAGGIYISDGVNHRVLYYAGTSTTATRVYGQPDFISNTANNGGISATSLNWPYGLVLGWGRLFIADYSNNRVIMY
ncbi:MAG: NHL repeat-containing protein [Spirochaetes bacterium]|nr:NHL repeat-containing protein [Spirochaetota bacterium]